MLNADLLKAMNSHSTADLVNPDDVHFVNHLYRVDGTFGLVALVLSDCAQEAIDTIVDESDLLNAYKVSEDEADELIADGVAVASLGNYGEAYDIEELRITRVV